MPKSIESEEDVLKEIEDTYARYRRYRYNFERVWYRNILFMMGIQWINWDETQKSWKKRKLKKWVPTPVTNRFASSAERIVAVLSRIQPNWEFVPGSESFSDMVAAKAAEQLEGIIAEENDVESCREELAKWLTYAGNAYLLSGNDDGENYTDVLSPFEMYGDLSVPNLEDQEKIILVRRRDMEYIKRMYGFEAKEDEGNDIGQKYLESLGYISADLGLGDYAYFRDHRILRATVKRIYVRPNEDWPEGLYAVQAGDRLAEAMPLPQTVEGKPFIPIVQAKFDAIPGAFYGKTPMNDIVPKQLQRNRLESLMELISIRMANPVWMMPEGTRMGSFSGEPGAILRYNQVGDKSTPPQRIPGEQITQSLFNWLEKIDSDIEELASMFDAIKGKAPYSGAPGVVVDQLIEQGMNRFGPTLRGIGETWRQWMQQQIEMYRAYGDDEKIASTMGDNKRWKFSKFSRADFDGAVNVRIETDSVVPRSEAAQTDKIMNAIQTGLIDLSDPMDRHKILKKINLGSLSSLIDENVTSAVREHDMLLEMQPEEVEAITMAVREAQQDLTGQTPPPPIPLKAVALVHDDNVHIIKHRSFAISEEGKPFEAIMQVHIAEHMSNMDAMANNAPQEEPVPQEQDENVQQ
ncbi:MAG: hypothetical protein ACE5DX_05740 [Candidatus Dojkabacteria bacterium]